MQVGYFPVCSSGNQMMMPWAIMARATFMNPATLAPLDVVGESVLFLAVLLTLLVDILHDAFEFSSTSSELHDSFWEFWAISRPLTDTPPALAACRERRVSLR